MILLKGKLLCIAFDLEFPKRRFFGLIMHSLHKRYPGNIIVTIDAPGMGAERGGRESHRPGNGPVALEVRSCSHRPPPSGTLPTQSCIPPSTGVATLPLPLPTDFDI
jgi:hypothetical protein